MTADTSSFVERSDVIHDIGYRSYDGPRLGRGYATRSLLVHSLRGAYGLGRSGKSKILPMLLYAAMCLPALIVVAVVIGTKSKQMPFEYTDYAVFLSSVTAVFIAAQAPQLLSRDLRFSTVPLYFSRPLTRSDYVRAKFAAMTAAMFVLFSSPLLILYLGAIFSKMSFTKQTGQFLGGLVGAAVFSLLLAALGLVIAALTPRRGFGVAAIIAVVLVSYGVASSLQSVAWSAGKHDAAGWLGLLSPTTLADGVQSWLTSTKIASVEGPPGTLGGVVFLLVSLGFVCASYGLLVLRYRKV
jgi:ABC-2 type transport system permease protein